MKKLVFSLLLTAMAVANAVAQPAFSRGYENRSFTVDQFEQGCYLGAYNLLDVWVIEGKKNLKQLALLDRHLDPNGAAVLPESAKLEVLAAGMHDNDAAVLLVDRSVKNRTVVLRTHIDLLTMAVDPYDTVVRLDYERKDKCNVWAASSPNGANLGVVAIVEYTEQKQYRTFIAMCNNHGAQLWEKEFALGTMSDVFVTDDGRIVSLGYEESEQVTNFVVNVISDEQASSYSAAVKCDPIKELRLVNVVGSYAVAAGTYQPSDVRNADKLTAGVVGLSFNIESAAVAGITMRPFQNEELNMFLNEKTKKVQKIQAIDRITVQGYAPLSYGAAIAVGRTVRIEITKNGHTSIVRQENGVSVAAVDTTGHFRWVRNFRRFDTQKNENVPMTIGMVESDGKLCVVRSESNSLPPIYDIAKPAKEFVIGGKSNMAVYTINPDGDTEKLIVERKTKHTLLRPLLRQDGTIVLLTANGKYTRAAEMMFQY